MFELLRRQVRVTLDEEGLLGAATELGDRWHLRVPALLGLEELDRVRAEIAAGHFRHKHHPGVGEELCFEDDRLTDRLIFQLNDPIVLRAAARVCGSPVGCFEGRIYRVVPGAGHHDDWHNDLKHHRRLALTLNLSDGPYRGSVLSMRQVDAPAAIVKIPNPTPGDAVLFALREDLEHRISDIEGNAPKTALAGWFCEEPDFYAPFRTAQH